MVSQADSRREEITIGERTISILKGLLGKEELVVIDIRLDMGTYLSPFSKPQPLGISSCPPDSVLLSQFSTNIFCNVLFGSLYLIVGNAFSPTPPSNSIKSTS